MAAPFRPVANPAQNHGAGAGPPHKNPPSNNLWIGNVSPEVSEADLKSIFEKHGPINSVSTYSTRNYAFICFKDLESATSARENLQGHALRGSSLKIEFAKPAKPCKSLWVSGISPSVSNEELEKEFLRYGKIQELRFLRDRSTAYVDYVELEDATQALKNVNGKRIGGSQIRVDFLRSNSSKRELGPDAKEGQFPSRNAVHSDFRWMGQDSLNNYPDPGQRTNQFLPLGSQFDDGMPSKVLWIRHPPTLVLEEDMLHNAMILFGEIERINTFSDRNYAFVEFRSVEEARLAKDGLQGKLFNDPRISIDYFNDEFPGVREQAVEHPFQPVQMDIIGFNRTQIKSASGAWDAFNATQLQQQSKRPRFDVALPPGRTENQGELYRHHSLRNAEVSGSLGRAKTEQHHAERDCIWRGLIAKGGTPVCRARCVPVGEGLGADIPDVVNCSARTGLDLLSKHYDDAIGFGIVSILPDSEEDFASYTEFLRYLGSKDRAGVAKFDDGTTLFLVPPSDFLSKVLRVNGPPRLYGVVLKFPQAVPSSPALNQLTMPPHYADAPKMPTLQRSYGVITPEERVAHLDNSRVLPEDFKFPLNVPVPVTSSFSGHSVQPTTVAPQAGLALSPELIATLTSLLPANSGASCPQTSLLPQAHTMHGVMSNVASGVGTDNSHWKLENQAPDHNSQFVPQLGGHGTSNVASGVGTDISQWKLENQAPDHNSQFVPQLGGHFNSHLQHLQAAQTGPIVSTTAGQFHQSLNSFSQIHDQKNSFSSQGATSLRPIAPVFPLQSEPEINQLYQQQSSHDVLRGQVINNVSDSLRQSYNSSIPHQPAYTAASSNQKHVNKVVSLPQPYVLQPSEVELTHQSPPLQANPYGVTPENAETEADKNERYKSTLLFAANLLSKIHQPSGTQPGQGAGSH